MTDMTGPHVLVVPSWWPSPQSPLNGIFFTDYVRAFADAGAKVGVLVIDFIHLRDVPRTRDRPIRPRMDWDCLDGVPVLRLRGLHTALGRPAFHMHRFRRWLQRGLREYRARHGDPNVLHAGISVPAGWACTHLDDPLASRVVLTELTGPFALALTPPAQGRLVRAALERAAEIVTVSRTSLADMRSHGVRRPLHLCGNSVAPVFCDAPCAPRPPQTPPRALFVGRFVPEKGLFDLAASVCGPAWDIPVEWHFVGDGPARDSLRQRFSGRSAVFHGPCDRSRIVQIMDASDFFVFPSHGETFGLAAAEALCRGLPLLTTHGAACAEFVDESNGILVQPRNPASLRDGLRQLLNRLPAYDRIAIAEAARRRFSPRAVADFYVALFRRLAQ